MKKIAILGGTFDPIHNQHIRIAKIAYQVLKLDELWIMPNKLNPLKKKTYSTPKQRLKMIKLAIKKEPWIKIVDYEINSKNEVNYTIDTIQHFRKIYQNSQFYFIIGSDNLFSLEKWKKIDELIKYVKIIVINRPHFHKTAKLMKKYCCLDLKVKPSSSISSTKIRSGEAINQIDPLVNQYINKNMLYYEQRLKANLDDKKIIHSLNTGEMARKLAAIYNVNKKKAWIAGTYHDIAKQWNKEKITNYLQKYMPSILKLHPNIYHGYVGAIYLKYDWKVKDKIILNAIMKHTQGALKMSKLELIVLLADKISMERNYPYVNHLRELTFTNLELAFVEYLEILKISLINRNIEITPELEAIYQTWKRKVIRY